MRYNIFHIVHQGLRAMLYETALNLQQAAYTDADELAGILQQVRLVVTLFDKHACTEDNLVFTALRDFEPAVVDAFEQEHAEDHKIIQRLSVLLDQLELGVPARHSELWISLNEAFINFLVFNLTHMAHEETVINQLLWRYFTDAELKQITDQIKANTETGIMKQYCKWMLRGLNQEEIFNWLQQARQHQSGSVFNELVQLASTVLPASRWHRLQAAFAEDKTMLEQVPAQA